MCAQRLDGLLQRGALDPSASPCAALVQTTQTTIEFEALHNGLADVQVRRGGEVQTKLVEEHVAVLLQALQCDPAVREFRAEPRVRPVRPPSLAGLRVKASLLTCHMRANRSQMLAWCRRAHRCDNAEPRQQHRVDWRP